MLIHRGLPKVSASADGEGLDALIGGMMGKMEASARDMVLKELRLVRTVMRERGLIPPELSPEFADALGEGTAAADG